MNKNICRSGSAITTCLWTSLPCCPQVGSWGLRAGPLPEAPVSCAGLAVPLRCKFFLTSIYSKLWGGFWTKRNVLTCSYFMEQAFKETIESWNLQQFKERVEAGKEQENRMILISAGSFSLDSIFNGRCWNEIPVLRKWNTCEFKMSWKYWLDKGVVPC